MMISHAKRNLAGTPSFLLDFLRIFSALVVFATHVYDQWNPGEKFHNISQPGKFAHGAVVIFFVLSGYVIAHTTLSHGRGPSKYYVSRLSRLCSVMIPALVITALCEIMVRHFDHALWLANQRGQPIIRYGLSALFCNEIWSLSAAPPINRPLWSLCYEFWYYLIFGLFFFRIKGLLGWLIGVVASCLAGPKILLMAPIWGFGLLAYRLRRPSERKGVLWSLCGGAALVGLCVFLLTPPLPYLLGSPPFYFANQFITDIILGFFVALVFHFLPDGSTSSMDDSIFARFRRFADLTFPIYVLHHPLLILWRSVFGTKFGDAYQGLTAFLSVLLASAILGWLMERYKGRWFAFFNFCAEVIVSKSAGLRRGIVP